MRHQASKKTEYSYELLEIFSKIKNLTKIVELISSPYTNKRITFSREYTSIPFRPDMCDIEGCMH